MSFDRYQSDTLISESETTLVWRGHEVETGTPVIIKVASKLSPPHSNALGREYELMGALRGVPGVPAALALVEVPHNAIVMSDGGGVALSRFVLTAHLKVTEVLQLGLDVLTILRHVHARGIVHRDVCPSNLVYHPQTHAVQLIDFGAADALSGDAAAGLRGTGWGTLAYMSPEQTGQTNRGVDERTDFYSLGAVLYSLLASSAPFAAASREIYVRSILSDEPPSLQSLRPTLPPMIVEVVAKMMRKNAGDRYHSAHGAEYDLRRCLDGIIAHGDIQHFTLAEHETSDRLTTTSKLYGRSKETQTLRDAFRRTLRGHRELCLVSGLSGVGKSALVGDLMLPIKEASGYFAVGKYDQLRRHVPFSAIRQAIDGCVRHILLHSPEFAEQARARLSAAMGVTAQLLLDIVPSVQLILGPQRPVPAASLQEAELRLLAVFVRFLEALSEMQPFVLFLDDLQWADSGTLKLLEVLLEDARPRAGMLVIAAYRPDEVDPEDPTGHSLLQMRHAVARVTDIRLTPLGVHDIEMMLQDWTQHRTHNAGALAEHVLEKTAGNPFFIVELLKHLWQKKIWTSDPVSGEWTWAPLLLQEEGVTKNVVELLTQRMRRMPAVQQELAALCACLGVEFELSELAEVTQTSVEGARRLVTPLIDAGLLRETSSFGQSTVTTRSVRFVHDRVQQVAHELVDEEKRIDFHYTIGRRLVEIHSADTQSAWAIEAVDHLNRAAQKAVAAYGAADIAGLNLFAARECKRAMAYGNAVEYLSKGLSLMDQRGGLAPDGVAWSLQLEMADNEFLLGEGEAALRRLDALLEHTTLGSDQAVIYKISSIFAFGLGRLAESVDRGLLGLKALDFEVERAPSGGVIQQQMEKVLKLLEGRDTASMVDAPPMTDGLQRRRMEMMSSFMVPAFWSAAPLSEYLSLVMAEITLRDGASDTSAFTYSNLCHQMFRLGRNYPLSKRLWQVVEGILEKDEYVTFAGFSILVPNIFVIYIGLRPDQLQAVFYRTFVLTQQTGERTTHMLACNHMLNLALRTSLVALQDKARAFDEVYRRTPMTLSHLLILRQTAACLRSETLDKFVLSTEGFDESRIIQLLKNPRAWSFYWGHRAMVLYLHGDLTGALGLVTQMDATNSWSSISAFDAHLPRLVAAIVYTAEALQRGATEVAQPEFMRIHAEHFALYAASDSTFRGEHALIAAQLAAVHGEHDEATRFYDDAVANLDTAGYTYATAIGFECAAQHMRRAGRPWAARGYIQRAVSMYELWGASAKVDMLRKEWRSVLHDAVWMPALKILPQSTASSASRNGDAAAVMDCLHAVLTAQDARGVAEALAQHMMKVCNSHRVVVLQMQNSSLQVLADTASSEVFPQPLKGYALLPHGLITYVAGMGNSTVINNTLRAKEFTADPYFRAPQAKSMMCTPFSLDKTIVGMMVIENHVLHDAFVPDAVKAVELVARTVALTLGYQAVSSRFDAELSMRLERSLAASRTSTNHNRDAAEVQLAGGFAHEMRNALSGAQYLLSALAAEEGGSEGVFVDLAEVLDSVGGANETLRSRLDLMSATLQGTERAISRGLSITDMVMDYAHLGHLAPAFVPVDVDAVVGRLCGELTPELQAHGITIEVDVPLGMEVRMAEKHFYAILRNLTKNAADAIRLDKTNDKDKRIEIRAANIGAFAAISVADTGPGIAAHVRARIFQPFFTTKGVEGNGLGLGMCKKISESYGATLEFESEEGAGSVFTLRVPSQPRNA